MVPEGWKIKSLGEICDGNLQTGPFGSQLHANEYTASGTPVLMPKDFVDGKVNLSGAAKISHNRASDLSKHKLQTGDLLFSRRGDVTRFALITEDVAGALCGTGCLRARPSSKHTPLFLAYFLQKNAVQKWLEQNAVGQTMPNMNTAILSELPLMVSTNTDEEEKIARILSTWDKAIETVEKLIENSQAQKKALMQQLLTGKRRLPGFDDGWLTYKLSEIFHFKKGKGLSKGEINSDGKYKCILYGELYTKYAEIIHTVASRTNSNNALNSAVGDVLIPCSTTTSGIDLANTTCLQESNVLLGGDITVLRPKNQNIDPEFVAYLLTHVKKHEIARLAQGITIIHLYGRDLKNIAITLPGIIEQKEIVKVMKNSDKEIDLMNVQLNHLQDEKKALMQQLLTGKRRVQTN